MQRIAILGLGLMGGSLGLALKSRCSDVFVLGYARREDVRDRALSMGACDEVFSEVNDAVRTAEVVVICVPVMTTGEILDECKGAFPEGCVITDVGSTKADVMREAAARLKGSPVYFVGSHPIAGSEQTGIEAASADLYEGAVVVVTPGARCPDPVVDRLCAMWRRIGAHVRTMDADEHDRYLARTSHLPHVAAVILASAVARKDGRNDAAPFCGTGFIDGTRIADGAPELWRDIIETNLPSIRREFDVYKEEVARFSTLLARGDMSEVARYLQIAREARRAILKGLHESKGEAS